MDAAFRATQLKVAITRQMEPDPGGPKKHADSTDPDHGVRIRNTARRKILGRYRYWKLMREYMKALKLKNFKNPTWGAG
jgi:hypothetical protein